jgi:hypothetical protein
MLSVHKYREGAGGMKAKRKGRPPLPEGEKASINLTMRIRPEMSERLKKASAISGRSISAEAEQRLNESFDEGPNVQVMRAVRNAIEVFERTSGKKWFEDESTSMLALNAAMAVLRAIMLPPGRENEHVIVGTENLLTRTTRNISKDYEELGSILAHRPMVQILEAIKEQEKRQGGDSK